jgi:glyoxylase-like metal-dependent hydrolase (beta-lactamase superfamily II)
MSLEIHPLKLAEVQLDTSMMVWQLTPGTPIDAPCTAFLILGGAEPILVDSGIAMIEPPFSQTPDQALSACLARHGLEPADIGLLVHTHLHVDHAGLDDQLPNARILVQRDELEFAATPGFPPFFYSQDDIDKLRGPLRERVELLDGDAEIVPGVRAVVTGGHTPAHQMLYVDLDSGQAIITGDIVYLLDPGLEQQLPPGYWVSLPDLLAALARIKQDAAYALPSHDPAVYERYAAGVR